MIVEGVKILLSFALGLMLSVTALFFVDYAISVHLDNDKVFCLGEVNKCLKLITEQETVAE